MSDPAGGLFSTPEMQGIFSAEAHVQRLLQFEAGLAAGTWRTLAEIEQLPGPRELFEPRISGEQRAKLYAGWQAAVARATSGTPGR